MLSMHKIQRFFGALVMCVVLAGVASTAQCIEYTYDFNGINGSPAGPALGGQDNWTADSSLVVYDNIHLSNAGFDGNEVGFKASGWGYRPSDENWSFAIPANSVFTVEWTARIGISTRYVNFGIGSVDENGINLATAFRMGAGGSMNGWYFRDADLNNVFTSTDNYASTDDESWRIKLEIDLAANEGDGAASLSTGLIASDDTYTLIPVSNMQNMDMDLGNSAFNLSNETALFLQGSGYGAIDNIAIITVEENEPIPGDANNDKKVDGSDVTILAGNWQVGVDGTTEATWEMGDFNGDKKVDGSDVTILAGNWQAGVTAAVAAVPEPSTLILLFGGLLFVWIGRRR